MMDQQYRNITFVIASLAFQSSTSIADELNQFDDSFYPDLPVVTSASRIAESVVNSASSVTVIDRAMIDASGFIELADIFRLVPGYQVAYASSNTIGVVPHGFGNQFPNRLQVLIDGRSTYLPSLSVIDWVAVGLELEDIERIEVVRGPAPSAYGSNAFAGAINIMTRPVALDDAYQVSSRVGNNGERNVYLKHSARTEKNAYRITASHRQTDGIDSLDDTNKINSVNSTAQFDINANNSISSTFSFIDADLGGEELAKELNSGQGIGFGVSTREVRALSAQLSWSHLLSYNEELKTNLYHNFRDEDDMANSDLISEFLSISPAVVNAIYGTADQQLYLGRRTNHSHRTDIEVQYSKVFNSGFQYVAGLSGRYDTLSSKALLPKKGTVSEKSIRAFGNVQLPIASNWIVNFAGLVEKFEHIDLHFSPKVGVNWHISDYQAIRTSYSRAYRMPSLLERNFDADVELNNGLITDQLYRSENSIEPESINSYEIGYLGHLKQQPLSWEIKLYKEQYRHVIDAYFDRTFVDLPDFNSALLDITDDSLLKYGNGAQFDIHGIEGELMFRPTETDFIRFHFNIARGRGTTIKGFKDEVFTYESIDRTFPNNSLGILASKSLFDLQWGIGVYHIADSEWRDEGDIVDAYTRIDLSVSKAIKLDHNKQLKIKLSGQNIANQSYNEFDDQTEFEPRYFLTFVLTQN